MGGIVCSDDHLLDSCSASQATEQLEGSVMRKAVVVSFAMVMAELSCCLDSDEGAFGCDGLGEASDA